MAAVLLLALAVCEEALNPQYYFQDSVLSLGTVSNPIVHVASVSYNSIQVSLQGGRAAPRAHDRALSQNHIITAV